MSRKIWSLLVVGMVFVLSSCVNKDDIELYVPNSVGKQGAVKVVMNTNFWKSKMGDLVRERLGENLVYYPQQEPLFDLTNDSYSQFSNSAKRHRNILQMEVNKHPEVSADVNYSDDVWAKNQAVVKVIGKTQQELAQLFVNNAEEIKNYFLKKEIERLKESVERSRVPAIEEKIKQKHKLSIAVPDGYGLMINNENCFILERERLRSAQGSSGDIDEYIIGYHYPYKDSTMFTKEY